MAGEIIGAIQSLKTAKDILKALYSLKVSVEIQAQLSELSTHLLSALTSAIDARIDQQTMADRIRELEKEVLEFEDWEAEKERYELEEIAPGRLAYAIKSSMITSEPPHYICPNCYEDRIKSILVWRHRFVPCEAYLA